MIEIKPHEAGAAIKSLFSIDLPAGLRSAAVLEGIYAGRIFTDDPANPTWGVIQEGAYGTLYPAGALNREVLESLILSLVREGDVLIGLWQSDPLIALLPTTPEYEGTVLDYTGRRGDLSPYLTVPNGCAMRPVDRTLLERSADREMTEHVFGSLENALKHGLGYYLMRGDDILCETFAGPAADGRIEVGVTTYEAHRQQGYATLTCAYLIRACEEKGYQTYWNCNAQNVPSLALARKLGYQRERPYRLYAWFKSV
jgi:GNAT superfamily N-acetyltransferase